MERKYRCKSAIASHAAENLSRLSLLKWLNEILGSNIQKVEELCNGTAYCQILAMLFPGSINLRNVKRNPRTTHDFYLNFRLLDYGLHHVGCDKIIHIDSIIKGRFQENFEFLKWFKRFCDANYAEPSSASMTLPGSSKQQACNVLMLNPQHTFAERKVKLEYEIAKHQDKATVLKEEIDFYLNKAQNIEKLCYNMSPATEKEEAVNKILMELHATAEGFETPEDPEEE